jgi:hypothetical protein
LFCNQAHASRTKGGHALRYSQDEDVVGEGIGREEDGKEEEVEMEEEEEEEEMEEEEEAKEAVCNGDLCQLSRSPSSVLHHTRIIGINKKMFSDAAVSSSSSSSSKKPFVVGYALTAKKSRSFIQPSLQAHAWYVCRLHAHGTSKLCMPFHLT